MSSYEKNDSLISALSFHRKQKTKDRMWLTNLRPFTIKQRNPKLLTRLRKLSKMILQAVGRKELLLEDAVALQQASFELREEWFADSAAGMRALS